MSVDTTPCHALKPEWFDAIARRHSRRTFDGRAVEPALLDRVEATCRQASEGRDARVVLVRSAPANIFKGVIGSYGKIVGAPSVLAFVGTDHSGMDVGYAGESVVLDATLAGLDTCWNAGFFSPERVAGLVDLAAGERVCAVSPLGYATETMSGGERRLCASVKADTRMAIAEIAPGCDSWPAWAREAAEAVRVAPSGCNAQPWRLRFEAGSLVLGAAARVIFSVPIDMGIAMLHAELGALHAGVRGAWEILSPSDGAPVNALKKPTMRKQAHGSDVARFVPAEEAR
jgi:hypothetical protein